MAGLYKTLDDDVFQKLADCTKQRISPVSVSGAKLVVEDNGVVQLGAAHLHDHFGLLELGIVVERHQTSHLVVRLDAPLSASAELGAVAQALDEMRAERPQIKTNLKTTIGLQATHFFPRETGPEPPGPSSLDTVSGLMPLEGQAEGQVPGTQL